MRRVIGKILHIAVLVIAWVVVAAVVIAPAVFLNTVYGYLPALLLALLLIASAVSLLVVSRNLSAPTCSVSAARAWISA